MRYWEYLKKNRVIIFVVVVGIFLAFYLLGLAMPEVNSLIELKWLALILGIPITVFIIGNYVNWRKLNKNK